MERRMKKARRSVYVSYGIYIFFVFLMLGVPIAFSLGLGSVVAIFMDDKILFDAGSAEAVFFHQLLQPDGNPFLCFPAS